MGTKTISVFDVTSKGWRYVYRGKKAHYFKNRISLCKKQTISKYEEGGLLPNVNTF